MVTGKDDVEQLEAVIRSMSLPELVRALRRVYPDVDWPGPNRSPRIEVDLKRLEKLGTLCVTVGEAADVLGVSRSTLTRRLREPVYRCAWNRGRVAVKIALRRKQIDLAMAGNVTMLIWLGKQLLGQKNDPEPPAPLPRETNEFILSLDELESMLDEVEAELSEKNADGGPNRCGEHRPSERHEGAACGQ